MTSPDPAVEAAAKARGDVHHHVNPVIGWLRRAAADGTPLDKGMLHAAIDHLALAKHVVDSLPAALTAARQAEPPQRTLIGVLRAFVQDVDEAVVVGYVEGSVVDSFTLDADLTPPPDRTCLPEPARQADVVETVEELLAPLIDGTCDEIVVVDADQRPQIITHGTDGEFWAWSWQAEDEDSAVTLAEQIPLPARVLWRPEGDDRG